MPEGDVEPLVLAEEWWWDLGADTLTVADGEPETRRARDEGKPVGEGVTEARGETREVLVGLAMSEPVPVGRGVCVALSAARRVVEGLGV